MLVAVYPYLAIIVSVLYFNLVEVKGGQVVAGGGPTAGIEQAPAAEGVEVDVVETEADLPDDQR